ncbi:DNA-directed RNA polymerase II subunit rpb4 [Glugoides intestinalis]
MKAEKDPEPITVNDVYHILAPLKARYKNTRSEAYQIYKKTLDYSEMFCKIQDKAALADLKFFLAELGMNPEEIAIIGSLLPQSADEARIYLPSLSRLDDGVIFQAIDKIQSILM